MPLRKTLGKGLNEILAQGSPAPAPTAPGPPVAALQEVEVSKISPSKAQPRRDFDPVKLKALANSVAKDGILQPIMVRQTPNGYELIAGERRLRAAIQAGLERIPVYLKDAGDDRLLQLALVENLQRENLNPIERALAYRRLMRDHPVTQEQAAETIGEQRSTFANYLRLLDLPPIVQDLVSRETITTGHARAILGLGNPAEQERLAARVVRDDLSVRQTEALVATSRKPRSLAQVALKTKPAQIRSQEDILRRLLGTKVTVTENRGHGKIVIEFFSEDDFARIVEILRGNPPA